MKNFDRLELLLSLAVPLAGLVVAACGGSRGADPDDIQAGLDEVVVPLVDDSTAAFQFIDDSSALENMNGAMGGVRIGAAWGEEEGASDIEPDPEGEVVDPNEPTPGEEIARFLREVIFTE